MARIARIVVPNYERTGRPLGDDSFIERLGTLLKRRLQRGKPGPKGPSKHRSNE